MRSKPTSNTCRTPAHDRDHVRLAERCKRFYTVAFFSEQERSEERQCMARAIIDCMLEERGLVKGTHPDWNCIAVPFAPPKENQRWVSALVCGGNR